jgi:hypothetical protein
MNGLPLKFKLYYQGKHVGFMKWINLSDQMTPMLSQDGNWWGLPTAPGFRFNFDELRQYTGIADKNGKEIYLFDRLIDENKEYSYAVGYYNGNIAAVDAGKRAIVMPFYFNEFEVLWC